MRLERLLVVWPGSAERCRALCQGIARGFAPWGVGVRGVSLAELRAAVRDWEAWQPSAILALDCPAVAIPGAWPVLTWWGDLPVLNRGGVFNAQGDFPVPSGNVLTYYAQQCWVDRHRGPEPARLLAPAVDETVYHPHSPWTVRQQRTPLVLVGSLTWPGAVADRLGVTRPWLAAALALCQESRTWAHEPAALWPLWEAAWDRLGQPPPPPWPESLLLLAVVATAAHRLVALARLGAVRRDLAIYGWASGVWEGWAAHGWADRHRGELCSGEAAAVFAQTPITLHISWFHPHDRLAQVGACGGFPLCDRLAQPTAWEHHYGGTLVGTTLDELPEAVAWWLAHPQQRQGAAQALQAEVLAHHTWQQRAQQIVADLEDI